MTPRTGASFIDLTPILGPERAALLEFLRGLAPADWERPTECPAWNVKGLVLHVLGDDFSLLSRQRDAATNGLLLFAEDHPGLSFRQLLDGFNEQWVRGAYFASTEVVLDLLALTGAQSEDFYCGVDPEATSGEPVGFFGAAGLSPYWQVIAREYVERFIHQSQLRRAVGAPELAGDFVTAAARVIVHAATAWLRHYEAAAGSTIGITFGRSGEWTWKRESEHWVVLEGAPPSAMARVTIAPEHTVAALSRGLAPEAFAAATATEGDHALAAGTLAIVAPLLVRPINQRRVRMVSFEDAVALALDLPEVTEGARHGHRTFFVAGKAFAWERPFSKADIKRFGDETPPAGPIIAVTVEDLGEKEAVLAMGRPGFFTISHFDGYAAVLIQLKTVRKKALREALVDAWLACAPEELAAEFLAK